MENTNFVEVINRHSGTVGYFLPETNTRRVFARGEKKRITIDELEKLSWVDGGDYILKNYLIIKDKDALTYLNMADQEPEYFYTEESVKDLLLLGTLDQLDDALQFGPEGVKELIKDIAVKVELPDTRKRKLILNKLGFNVDVALQINEIVNEPIQEDNEKAVASKRKAEPITTSSSATPERKTSGFKTLNS